MADCGKLLRRAREKLGLSVADIASELHLSRHQIQALEEDDWDRLPGITYTRGYLKSYARVVDLDPEDLLAGLAERERQIEGAIAREAEQGEAPEPEKRSAAQTTRGPWGWVAAILVLGVLGTWAWQVYWQPLSLPGLFEQEAPAVANPRQGTQFARPGHEAGSAAASGTAKRADVAGAAPESSTMDVLMDARHVVFQFEADSWIDVRDAAGERLVYRSYQAGRRIEIQGTPPFRVFLGNAPEVRVAYRGEVITPSSPAGRRFARFTLGRSGD